jgi:hypothetical protein
VAILLVFAGTGCVEDAFQNPLSDADSSKPEPRLVGKWVLETIESHRRLAVEVDPQLAGRLLVSVDKRKLLAQTLTLGERRYLFVQPPQAGESGHGWLLEYEHPENGPPRARLLNQEECSRAILAREAEGSFAYRCEGCWFPWLWCKGEPVLNLDADQTRRWLETRKETVFGPPQRLGQQLLGFIDKKTPMNSAINPQGDLALKPEPCDPKLLGVSVIRSSEPGKPGSSDFVFTVEGTNDPAVLVWSMDDLDFDKPLELLATEIDGGFYLTMDEGPPAGDEKEFRIYRYEFIDDDTVTLIPPDGDVLDTAVRAKVLSGTARKKTTSGDTDWLVTSSTEELRTFIAARGGECFPDRKVAPLVYHFKRRAGPHK